MYQIGLGLGDWDYLSFYCIKRSGGRKIELLRRGFCYMGVKRLTLTLLVFWSVIY